MAVINSTLTITDRGGLNPRNIGVSSLLLSWDVNRAGQLSGFATNKALDKAGLGNQVLNGKWINYEHPTAGRWSGVITMTNAVDGIVEITGQTFHILTRKRLVDISGAKDEPFLGSPGAIFKKAFDQISNSGKLFLVAGSMESGKGQVEVTWTGEDFYDSVIPQLTDDVGMEWLVTNDRVVKYGEKLGLDRSSSVLLSEGKEIISGTMYTDDMYLITNSVRGLGFGRIKKRDKNGRTIKAEFNVGPVVVSDATSVEQFGLLQERIDYGYVGTEQALRERAQRDLDRKSITKGTAMLNVADIDNAFSKFETGDTITVELGLSGIVAQVRVLSRALDVTSGIMAVSGTAVRQ